MQKKYVSLSKLSTFLDNLKTTFAALGHKHTINDLTDYTVDTELSSTSTNPVANNTVKTAIDEVKTYADEHDALMFEVTYNSDDKTYSLVDVTFDELNSYALQNKMVILRYNTAMFHFIRSVQSSDDTISLYYSQMYSNKHYYFRIKSDGSVGYYSTNLMSASYPTGTGSLSMNRSSSNSTGTYSSTLGYNNTASGSFSHAEGYFTTASGSYSHAEGMSTTAAGSHQHVQGKYNIADTSNIYSHIVGNGTRSGAYSNAYTLDWNGNAWFAGDVYVGSTSGTNKDDGSVKLATMDDIKEAGTKIQFITLESGD